MFRKALLAAACAAMLSVFADGEKSSTPKGFTDNLDEAMAQAKDSGRLIYACFSGSDWCGWCRKLEEEVFAKEEFVSKATNDFILVFIDSPEDKSLLSERAKAENPKLCKKYGIKGYPSALVMDADGQIYGKTGYRRGGPESYLKHLAGIKNKKHFGFWASRDAANRCQVDLDVTAAPELEDWAGKTLAPVLREWLGKLLSTPDGLLFTDGWIPPSKISMRFSDFGGILGHGDGGETLLGKEWFKENRDGEAVGAALFGLVRSLQEYDTIGASDDNCPEWAAVGIADYIRWYLFEPGNRRDISGKYLVSRENSSQDAASFLDFVEKSHPGTVKKLHAALRNHSYDKERFWKDAAGTSLCRLEQGWRHKVMFAKGWHGLTFNREKGLQLSVMFGPASDGKETEKTLKWMDDNFLPVYRTAVKEARDVLADGGDTALKDLEFILGNCFEMSGDDETAIITFNRRLLDMECLRDSIASHIMNTVARRMVVPGGKVGADHSEQAVDILVGYVVHDVCGIGEADTDFIDEENFDRKATGAGESFLRYVETAKPGTVAKLAKALRSGTFDDGKFWLDATGVPAETLEKEWKAQVLKGLGNAKIEVSSGEFRLTFDCTKAKSLIPWVRDTLAPIARKWTPRFAAMLASENRVSRKEFAFRFRPCDNIMEFGPVGTASFDADWFKMNLDGEAAGAAMFAVIHILQEYDADVCPEWLATGIADYFRWVVYEGKCKDCDAAAAGSEDGCRYNGAYKVTASFLAFVEKSNPGTVQMLNSAIHSGNFDDGKTWAEITGKTAKELEAEWVKAIGGDSGDSDGGDDANGDDDDDAWDPDCSVKAGDTELTFTWNKAKDMEDWTMNTLAPAVHEWTTKIATLLASDGWTPPKSIRFRYRPGNGMGCPAWTCGTSIEMNREWYREELKGEALGASIHELVHALQGYWDKPGCNESNCPGWLVEGLADYIRWFLFEPQSDGCAYLRTCDLDNVHYNDAYRTTGSFLDYVERNHPGTVAKLNALMREHKFDNGKFWKEATGKTAAELEAAWKSGLQK